MRKHKIITALLFITLALGVAGCTKEGPLEPKPEPSTTEPSATVTEPPSAAPEPDPTMITNAFLQDFSLLEDLKNPAGSQDAAFRAAKGNVTSFIIAQTSSPLFLTGKWKESPREDIIKAYGVEFSPEIKEYFLKQMDNPENALTTQSLGNFFTPQENTQPVESCTVASTELQDCLYGNYRVTSASVKYDEKMKNYSFAISVQGSQNLIVNKENKPLAFTFTNNITVNNDGTIITGLQNSFEFTP